MSAIATRKRTRSASDRGARSARRRARSAPSAPARCEERPEEDAAEHHGCEARDELAHVEKSPDDVEADPGPVPEEQDDDGDVREKEDLVEPRAREARHQPRAFSRWRLSFFVGRAPPPSRGREKALEPPGLEDLRGRAVASSPRTGPARPPSSRASPRVPSRRTCAGRARTRSTGDPRRGRACARRPREQFRSTFPPPHAAAACARVGKRHATSSQTSSRTSVRAGGSSFWPCVPMFPLRRRGGGPRGNPARVPPGTHQKTGFSTFLSKS